jgi:hypothetical protein
MSLLLLIVILVLVFGGGGFYGYRQGWYGQGGNWNGGFGIIGLILVVLLILWLAPRLNLN